jgi:hypothetical protein
MVLYLWHDRDRGWGRGGETPNWICRWAAAPARCQVRDRDRSISRSCSAGLAKHVRAAEQCSELPGLQSYGIGGGRCWTRASVHAALLRGADLPSNGFVGIVAAVGARRGCRGGETSIKMRLLYGAVLPIHSNPRQAGSSHTCTCRQHASTLECWKHLTHPQSCHAHDHDVPLHCQVHATTRLSVFACHLASSIHAGLEPPQCRLRYHALTNTVPLYERWQLLHHKLPSRHPRPAC